MFRADYADHVEHGAELNQLFIGAVESTGWM